MRNGTLLALATACAFLLGAAPAPRNPTFTIKNRPGAILVGQSYTLEADRQPPGGTYAWKVLNGAHLVTPTSGSGPTFTFTGVAASAKTEDVRIQVSYKGLEERCSVTVVGVKLKSVTFGGTGNRPISQDNGSGAYSTPHWFDNDNDGVATNTAGDRLFPTLYVAKSHVTVTRLTATVAPADFKRAVVDVRGTATDNHAFAGKGAIDRGVLTVTTAMVANLAVRDTVWFYDTYDINWEAALIANAFAAIGKSDDRVYVSLEAPQLTQIHETVAHLACKNGAGAKTGQKALDQMWVDFKDRDVRRKPIDGFNKADGVRMGYWRPPANVCQTLPQMLRSPTGNGACGAWANLLVAMTRVHGMTHPGSRIVEITADPAAVPATAPRPDGFLVQDWAFTHEFVHTGVNGVNNSDKRGDDDDIVKKDKGFPHTVCILPGGDGKLDSTPAGDDLAFGNMINTGPDGICDTKAHANDSQFLQQKKGKPNMPCILGGVNDKIDSTVNADDKKTTTAKNAPPYPYVIHQSAVNLPGIGGQDNPEPPESFFNHFVVLALGKYYDPSYGGGEFASDNAHENAASDGLKSGMRARRNLSNKRELRELLYTLK